MIRSTLQDMLLSIDSFEQYEQFKSNIDLLKEMAQAVADHHLLPINPLELFSEGTNIVFPMVKIMLLKFTHLFISINLAMNYLSLNI